MAHQNRIITLKKRRFDRGVFSFCRAVFFGSLQEYSHLDAGHIFR